MLRKHYPDHYNCKQQSRAGTETERHRQIDRQTVWDRDRQTDRQTESSLFTRVINKRYVFLHPALAQTRGYSKSNYTCTHFLSYDTPVHPWNKWSLDIKHDMRQVGMRLDVWGQLGMEHLPASWGWSVQNDSLPETLPQGHVNTAIPFWLYC